ncbi:FecR domain-containing protein [Flavihumibacter sp. UBA7668]|uniref:FecR domain-containing protein n=1 Tax=Flavihumibacter sp. UBA7668 TaxID=1946542 RepID=UPI0025BD0411|nr:FecR domain-containing protein [Flavihumibacter sp. UBA7668]
MSSNPIRLQYLLRKYLENKLTPEERPEFWNLLSELSENDLVSEELHQLWDRQAMEASIAPEQVQSAYQQLQYKIIQQKTKSSSPVVSVRRYGWQLAVAASVVFLLGLFWLNRPADVLISNEPTIAGAIPKMQPSMQTLPDGSIVSLNKKGKIDSIRFTTGLREVFLSGEGFFNVQHDADRPFLVHANGIITRVLGTSFNVKTSPGENRVSVTVTKGRVQVEKAGQQQPLAVLSPGEQLVVQENQPVELITKANIEEVIEWKNEALLFDNQSLPEAAEVLSKKFAVSIIIQDSIVLKQQFTADFSDKSLTEIMDIVSVLTGTSWRKQGDTVIIEETKKLP